MKGWNAHNDQSLEAGASLPPWRTPLGRAFFLLDSTFAGVSGEYISEAHGGLYRALLRRTFSCFSDSPIGTDVVIEYLHGPKRFEVDYTIDVLPMRGVGEGDQDITYDKQEVSNGSVIQPNPVSPC